MNTEEALDAARRNIDDAIDALDEVDEQSIATYVSVGALTIARILLQTRLEVENEGGESSPA